jgi:hypothetical protein
MSNRHQRRSDTRTFRRQVQRRHILTHLVDAQADLSGFPMLVQVAAAWTAAIPQRKPYCFGCRSGFANTKLTSHLDEAAVSATPGAYLFATPPGAADIASISVLCVECWRDLTEAEVDRAAATALRQVIPGDFLDAGRR